MSCAGLLFDVLTTTFIRVVLISLTVKTIMVPFLLRNDQKLHADNQVHNAPLKAFKTHNPEVLPFSQPNPMSSCPWKPIYSINYEITECILIIHKTILIFYITYQEQIPLTNRYLSHDKHQERMNAINHSCQLNNFFSNWLLTNSKYTKLMFMAELIMPSLNMHMSVMKKIAIWGWQTPQLPRTERP